MSELNKITGIVVSQYGEAIPLAVVDDNGVAIDISSYTTAKTLTLRDRYALKILTYALTFVTDGTDGEVQFTPSNGDIDRAGSWEGQIALESGSARVFTVPFDVEVEAKISAST